MNKPITKQQIQMAQVLITKNGLRDNKESIVQQFTQGRTISVKEMTLQEGKELIRWLVTHDPNQNMRKKVFSIAYDIEMIWGDSEADRKMNAIKIDNFLLARGAVKKKLTDCTREELVKIVNQFTMMRKHNEYTAAGKQTKQLLNELNISL